MTKPTRPKPRQPAGLRVPGQRLWRSVVDGWDLDEHELSLLVEAVRTVDLLDQLDAAVRKDGPIESTPQGRRAHPAAVEARQQRIALARLLAALRLPDGVEGDESQHRRQRRTGARGIYSIRGGAS